MVIIYVRCTEDWSNYSIEKFWEKQSCGDFASGTLNNVNLAREFIRQVNIWDHKMGVGYFEYRSHLKAIAQSNLDKYKICYNINELSSVDDDDIICPVDDDDWFRDDLNDKLPHYIEDADCLIWDQVVHTLPTFGPHRWFHCHDIVGSNNYAIRGKYIKTLSLSDKKFLLHNHVNFDNTYKKLKYRRVDDLLSCYLWHIGSFTYMLHNNILHGHKKLNDYVFYDNEMSWTKRQFDELASVYNKTTSTRIKDLKCL